MSFSARMLLGGAILALGLASVSAHAAQRLALIIGNDSYEMVTPLRKAVADARAYRDHLKGDRGFDEVFYVEDADEAAMLGAIGRFLSAIDPGDTALVVFSGHGVQLDPNRTDTLFLLPTDVPALRPEDPAAPFTLGAKAVRFTELRDQIAARGARTRVFVLDACRDNPFGKSADGTRSVGLARGLAPVQAADGEFIFYAAAPGDQALDRLSNTDDHPNSVFSRVFLEHFRSGAYLEDIANQVQREVYDLALTATPAFVQRPYYDDGVIGKGCLDARCGSSAGAPMTAGGCDGATARQLWDIASADNDCRSYESFIGACPGSLQSRFARSRLERLNCRGNSSEIAAAITPAPPILSEPRSWVPGVVEHRAAQEELKRIGDYRSGIDGLWGRGSAAALMAFERRSGLPVDGELSETDLAALRATPTPDRPTAPSPGERFRDCDACPEMIVIPGGSFTMGSPPGEPGRDSDEGPQRSVRVAPFAMGVYEATFAEWDACVADGYCGGYRPDDRGWGRGRQPVINVSWNDITAERGFLAWLNAKTVAEVYRLPSEAEWEYAARSGTTTAYSWGSDWRPSQANGVVHVGKTAEVGSYPANAFRLRDMSGNVIEWVKDCWNDSYAGAPTDGSAWMSGDCSRAVLRGGSWFVIPIRLRSANRGRNSRGLRSHYVGFRVSRTLRGR